MNPIRHVLIYTGHAGRGPYAHDVTKRIAMFKDLVPLRISQSSFPWSVEPFDGHHLMTTLSKYKPEDTLVVIPAGPSSELDQAFSKEETSFFIDYIKAGARGYFTCGSAFWVSTQRKWEETKKSSKCPLFDGKAIGPICSFPTHGFHSDAVEFKASDGSQCTLLVNGGGSFRLPKKDTPNIEVLLEYTPEELRRLRKSSKWKYGAIRVQKEAGQVLLVMNHPYYGPRDIDARALSHAFPYSGSDWTLIKNRLTPDKERLDFIHKHLIEPLERT